MNRQIIIIFYISVFVLSAAEFKVISFNKNGMDLTARKKSTKLLDANGNECAVIKVQTDLKDILFESPLLEKSFYAQDGEYWVYLQKNSKRIKFIRDEVDPYIYDLPLSIEESTVYILKLTAEGLSGSNENVSIAVVVEPSDSQIIIDDQEISDPKRINVSLGEHEIKLVKEGYLTKTGNIQVSENQTLFNFKLDKEFDAEFVFVEKGLLKRYGENTEHNVTISSFYIGKYEITHSQWKAIMGNDPSFFKGDNNPVERVSWYDAVEFCNKLSEMKGLEKCYTIDKNKKDKNNLHEYDELKYTVTCNFDADGYRLPTEAEWEFAARGGNKSKGYMYSGSNILKEVAECKDNNDQSTMPVGGLKPNELGIYDMSGNVMEWCWDWVKKDYSVKDSTKDPTGPSRGDSRYNKGGDYFHSTSFCHVADRFGFVPSCRTETVGFRIVYKPKSIKDKNKK